MTRMTESQLERRGRLAYELGRARSAAQVLCLILPLLLVAHFIGRPTVLVLVLGGALSVLAFALAVLHDRYARAVVVGALAGLPAFVLPLVIRSVGIVRLGSTDLDPCLPASFLSGVIAGAFVSARAMDEEHQLSFWLAAVAITALTGTLGCSVAGSAGVIGLMAGVVAGTGPVILRAGLRRI
jgi:hypothetical protein